MESRKIEKYTIYSNGRIHDDLYDADVKPTKGSGGYLKVKLFLCGGYSFPYLHKIIAMLFMPLYDASKKVFHIDGDLTNNDISNLDQIKYSEIAARKYSESLPEFRLISHDSYNEIANEFKNLDEAALWIQSTGVEEELYRIKLNIFNATDDKNKMAYGYEWYSI